MKKIKFLLLAALMVISFESMAQRGERGGERKKQTPEQIAERKTNRMSEVLELSDEQKSALGELNLERAKRMSELRKEENPDREAIKAERKAYEESLKSIVGDEKYEKWQQLVAQKREARHKGCCEECRCKGHRGDSLNKGCNERKGCHKSGRGHHGHHRHHEHK